MPQASRSYWSNFASWVLCGAILVGTVVSSPRSATAGDESFVGVLALASDPAVAKELGLSDEVQKQLKDYITKRVDDSATLVFEIKDLPQDEQKLKLQPFIAESEKEGLKLLSADQLKKLQQIRIQRLGMSALAEEGVADQLGLDKSQRGKIGVMMQLHEINTAAVPEAEKARAKVELEKQILAMLSDEQRGKWEQLEGRTGKTVAQAEVDPAKPMTDKPMAEKPGEEPGRTGPGSGSIRPAPGSTTKPPANTTLKAPPTQGLKVGGPTDKLKFQFTFTPWKDVINWFAAQADYSLVTDRFPEGTFNYTDTKAYTPAQAIDLLNSVLITKGFRLVRRERMLFLLGSDDELPDTFAPRIQEKDLEKQGDFEIVQCQFQLTKITAEEAEVEVKKLLSLHGKVVILSKARQLVVTDITGNLRLISNAIKAIENPDLSKDEEVMVVKMDHLRPSEFMASVGDTLLGIPTGMKATPDGSLKIAQDELGMRLIVTGKPEKIARLIEIKSKVDIVSGSSDTVGNVVETPQLEIYTLHNADPITVLPVLQTLLAGQTDVRLSLDQKSGNLIALCKPTHHATIKAFLDQLQKDATKPVVYKLHKNDPQSITLHINEIFGGGEKGGPNAPKVVADTTNLQIIVKASPAQLAQIEEMLKGMGELGGTAAAGGVVKRENARLLQGSGSSLDNAMKQLEAIWPAVSANKNQLKVHRIKRETPQLKAGRIPETAEEKEILDRLEDYRPLESKPKAAPAPAPPPKSEAGELETRTSRHKNESPLDSIGNARIEYIEGLNIITNAKPRPNKSSSKAKNTKTHFVSQPGVPEKGTTAATTDKSEAAAEAPAAPVEKTVPGADITVSIGPNGILIASEDLDALDEFEARLRQLLDQRTNTKEPSIIHLKYAKANVAAALLQEILAGGPAAEPSGGGGGGLMGDLMGGMMGDSFLGGLLGMGGGGGGAATSGATGGAMIIPDLRTNALFISATPRDMDTINMYLQWIDIPESPEGPQPIAAPRFIPVKHSTADSIAAVVRQVYSSRMTGEAGGQQRQPSPQDLIQALRGGGRGGQQQQNKGEELKMTVGVDTRSNSLIVSAPDYLFKEVEALVKTLDVEEVDSDTTVKVVSLKSANADLITRSLTSLYGGSIVTNKTATTSSATGRGAGQPPGGGQRPGGGQPGQGNQGQGQGQPQAQPQGGMNMEMLQQLQQQMNRGGGQGGGRGGGGFGGGGGGFGGGGRGGR